MNLKKNVGFFLLGSVCGAIAGLLLAPERGQVTREKIMEGSMDLLTQGEGFKEDIKRFLTQDENVEFLEEDDSIIISKEFDEEETVEEVISQMQESLMEEEKKSDQ